MISFRQITFWLSVGVSLFLLIVANESSGGLLPKASADKGQQPLPVQNKIGSRLFDQFANKEQGLRRISNRPAVEVLHPFEKREAMIPMRDGVRLHTLIFAPSKQSVALPLLLNRTPYGVGQSNSESLNRRYNELVTDGYIFALQDIRGRYGSEGKFLMNRPLRDKNNPN